MISSEALEVDRGKASQERPREGIEDEILVVSRVEEDK